ncbi:MAG: hypothetical protein LUE24_14830 [Lachnospiraceae bacterium]|nr:hypothetical protein [Lachnospiraceae bacterium]
MYRRFLYYILQFEYLALFTAVSLIIVTAVLLVQMRGFQWSSRRRLMIITLFFNMPPRYMVYLAANYIQLMFVLSQLVTLQDIELAHLVFLVLLGLIQALAIMDPAESVRSFLGSVLLYAAFLIVDLLKTYIFDLRFDWRIAFVCFLLCAFLVLYSVYFFINSLKCLASRHLRVASAPPRVRKERKPRRVHRTPVEEAGVIDLDIVELDALDDIPETTEVLKAAETGAAEAPEVQAAPEADMPETAEQEIEEVEPLKAEKADTTEE